MSGVTKPWTVANFGNTLAMTVFFFLKMFEIWWRCHKWNKTPRKCFLFLRELDLNRERQILTIRNRILVIDSPCVNKNPMISNLNHGDIFQIISPHSDEKIWSKCSHEDFTSVWYCLTSWLSQDVLRRRWIVSGVIKPSTVANFGNTLAITIFFFCKIFEIWWRFHKWNKKPGKCFLFLRELDLNRERKILTIRNRIHVISSPCVNKNPMISNFNQGDICQIISPHSDAKIWWKCSHEDFTSVWYRLTCWLSKDVLRRRWIVSGVTKPRRVANFGNKWAMTMFFFLKLFKIWWRFHKWNKKPRKCFFFLRELDLNWEQEIITNRNRILVIDSPCVNKNPMISNLNHGDILQIISPHSDEKIWSKCSHEGFTSVWYCLTCWLSQDVLRRRWIVSGVTKPSTVANFGNTLAITIFFFCKIFEIWWRFHKWNKKPRKCFLFLRELDFNRERQILTIRNKILGIDSPCVNKNPMISNFNQGDIFQIISPHSDQKIW